MSGMWNGDASMVVFPGIPESVSAVLWDDMPRWPKRRDRKKRGTTFFLIIDVVHPSVRNVLEKRYNPSEATASTQASYLLVGSIILYPFVVRMRNTSRPPRVSVSFPEAHVRHFRKELGKQKG